jgi:DNA polymerase-3 subunit epsilon/ATP-dependent DNA helicase DinG
MERIFIAVDLEMTGLEVGEDEIIEIAAVKFRGNEVLETFSQLIKPIRSVPLKITRITGITEEDLASSPSFNDVAPAFVKFLSSHPLVGHSVSRDLEMLNMQGISLTQRIYDTFELAQLILPQLPSYRLASLAEYYGIEHTDAHRALSDSDVSRLVFMRLLEEIRALDIETLTSLELLMEQSEWTFADIFAEIRKEKLRSTFVEKPERSTRALCRAIFSETGDLPLWGGGQTNPPSVEPGHGPIATNRFGSLTTQAIDTFFQEDGPIDSVFDAYEPRPQQVEMAHAVANGFREDTSLLVEAGTGVGKSMAYLVPAALFSLSRGEPVVISTNTINLQDQLYFKDIPDLQRMLQQYPQWADSNLFHSAQGEGYAPPQPTNGASPLKAALLKGRRNYLCLHRLKALMKEPDLEPEEARVVLKVLFWLPTTTSGDYHELRLIDRERIAWNRVNVPEDRCTGPRCNEFSRCFFYRARRKAEQSHLIVINHALLFADMAAQSTVVPPHERLIIDEAHNIEDVATSQFSFKIDQFALNDYFDELINEGRGGKAAGGLLAELAPQIELCNVPESDKQSFHTITKRVIPIVKRAREAVMTYFKSLDDFVKLVNEENNPSNYTPSPGEHVYDIRLRLTPATRTHVQWRLVADAWENVQLTLEEIQRGFDQFETLLTDLKEYEDSIPDYDELLIQVQSRKRFAVDTLVQAGHIIEGSDEHICWLNHEPLNAITRIHIAPLNVSPLIEAYMLEQLKSCILTSATLSINGTFEFIKDRLGLHDVKELQLDSPFDYRRQALVYIPSDIPEPNQRGYQPRIERALIDLCGMVGGRTLVLFTSNNMLRKTMDAIQDSLEQQDIIVLGQGVSESRRTMVERFKEWSRTVLLGTSSFWEGVDIVGDTLSVLVITRLPFQVPSDPIFAARSEQFDEPFVQYAVPNSILRFKQGFGRLIRSSEDYGIVVVLDKRLISKRYGAQFLESLPHTCVQKGSLNHLPRVAKEFLERWTDVDD